MRMSPRYGTLFHLVPLNDLSSKTLKHSDNTEHVSPTSTFGPHGLEVGFHLSQRFTRTIAKIGRGTHNDLILEQGGISGDHMAFKYEADTTSIMLLVTSDDKDAVHIRHPLQVGPSVFPYKLPWGQDCEIKTLDYHFRLMWRHDTPIKELKKLAMDEYKRVLDRQPYIPKAERDTDRKSYIVLDPWHDTRVAVSPMCADTQVHGHPVNKGSYGMIYRATNSRDDRPFAIKRLIKNESSEVIQRNFHREAKFLGKVKHENIIKFYGVAHWDSTDPELHMAWRPGTLAGLAQGFNWRQVSEGVLSKVLSQMLSALDYLAAKDICHRDVKPSNILCFERASKNDWVFELADFGMACFTYSARQDRESCGTDIFMAPEMFSADSMLPYDHFIQGTKADVWSLFATITNVHPDINYPPAKPKGLEDFVLGIQNAAKQLPSLSPMAMINPEHRASAAQMLMLLFEGSGMTTKRARVTPYVQPVLEPDEPRVAEVPEPSPSGEKTTAKNPTGGRRRAKGRDLVTQLVVRPRKERLPLAVGSAKPKGVAKAGNRADRGARKRAGIIRENANQVKRLKGDEVSGRARADDVNRMSWTASPLV